MTVKHENKKKIAFTRNIKLKYLHNNEYSLIILA